MDPRSLVPLVERRLDEYLQVLAEMVNTDCGTYSPDGVNRIADLCEQGFRAGGWEVDRRRHGPTEGERQLGDLLIGRLSGDGGPRVLLIGHMDTVFPDGTVAARPFGLDGGRATGPGVDDMKGGLLAGFVAVEALQEAGFRDFSRIVYVCNPDEEIGSPYSKPVILELARDADVCFVLEAGRENGNIVSARKGTTDFVIEVVGRAAHAGVEPHKGRSAILEAAHKVLALHQLNARWPGVTVNAGVISGGTRPNVVPDRCRLEVDLRAADDDSFDAASEEIARVATTNTVDGVTSSVKALEAHRPMQKTEATARLVALAQDIARDLGFEVRDQATGGASDANTVSSMGVPTLDGLGPVGGGAHGPDEWLDVSSVVPRVSMLAALIARAGEAVDSASGR
ncbi:MAG: M20 family metallopeptidase [Actinomycetota bacterium]|nr:M20 family metallopeptidase [Actinomycetota bacterium]